MIKKPVRIFPQIYNRSPFEFVEHPVLHPSTTDYKKYWIDIERKCIEGMWGLDSNGVEGGWRYMPPQLYFYIHIGKIVDEADDGSNEIINPDLIDLAWIMGYDWLACRRFSGFDEDEEFTCCRVINKLEKGIALNAKELLQLEKLEHVKKSDGTYKKYINAIDYLHQTFDKPLGLPVYENEALNYFCLGSRGIGKSFFAANAMIIHEATFEGATRYSYDLRSKKSEIVVGSAIETKSTDLLQKVDLTMKYLKNNIGSYQDGKKFTPGFFSKPWEGSFYSGKKLKINKYQSKESGEWLDQGDETTIYHVTFTVENPQAAVGKRPSVIVVEEVGLLGNVTTVHGANETAQIRKTKFGSTAYIGTGGNMAKVKDSKIIFEDAVQYSCLDFKDIFEGRAKNIGRFIPATYTERIFKDDQGNTKIEEAFEYEMQVRAVKATASTSDALDEYVQSRPLWPSEMFLAKAGNVFPVSKLRERAAYVEVNKLDQKIWSVGHLEYVDKEKKRVRFINDLKGTYTPIVSYNIDRYNDLRGALVVYEHPPENIPDPTYKRSLYKVVYDPVKDDHKGTSLSSIIVYKGFPDSSWEGGFVNTIVAEFIGRYDSVNDMHEIAIKLAKYYNAKIMPETNISDFIRYCKMTNNYNILQPAPTVAISKVIGRNFSI